MEASSCSLIIKESKSWKKTRILKNISHLQFQCLLFSWLIWRCIWNKFMLNLAWYFLVDFGIFVYFAKITCVYYSWFYNFFLAHITTEVQLQNSSFIISIINFPCSCSEFTFSQYFISSITSSPLMMRFSAGLTTIERLLWHLAIASGINCFTWYSFASSSNITLENSVPLTQFVICY